MLIVNNWFGRTGNNILQLIRAIHYAKINNHNNIKFNKHSLLNKCEIIIELDTNITINNTSVIDTFFSLKKFDIIDPEPYIMKKYFQKYIKPIYFNYDNKLLISKDALYIHFRGGDIFSKNPHNAYVQPPLSYYTNIINDYNAIKMVCEDKNNPCINELLKIDKVEYISNTLKEDLSLLSNASNVVIGFGTFGFLLYLMNINLKNLYIPGYFANELPKGDWGNDIKVHVINLPNYIKVGDWKNSVEQRQIMLEYP